MINNADLHPVGGGGAHCRPTHAKCAAVWFQAGESYTFVDGKDRKYVLKVSKIKTIALSDKAGKDSASGRSAGLSTVAAPVSPAAAPPLVDLIAGG